MKICFLLTHIPNPRINKRIELLKKTADVSVICVRRTRLNIFEPIQDVRHIILEFDFPESKYLLKRYIVSAEFRRKALEKLYDISPDVIYAEGLDCLMTAGQYKQKQRTHVVLEIADLRETYISQPKNPAKRVLKALLLWKERREFENVELLVITSPKFYDAHFNTLISKDRTVFIPNFPDMVPFKKYRRKTSGEFTVGFIGGIRYLKQMKLLVDGAGAAGCRVLFAGCGNRESEFREILQYCRGKDYVSFSGKFEYDHEIADLYGSIDCVFAVYDADNPNVRIALPNKFYEAIMCELPLISAKGTYLGELTEQWGIGITVGDGDTEGFTEMLKKLRADKEFYEMLSGNCRKQKSCFNMEEINRQYIETIEKLAASN